jgi:hypothetical protein
MSSTTQDNNVQHRMLASTTRHAGSNLLPKLHEYAAFLVLLSAEMKDKAALLTNTQHNTAGVADLTCVASATNACQPLPV